MRVEEKIHRLMCKTGACSLVLGILTLVGGLTIGILEIVNGSRLLKHNSDIL